MSKDKSTDELFEDYDLARNYGEFQKLQRRDPLLAKTLQALIDGGVSPERILDRETFKRPYAWVEAQTIYAAALYLKASGDQ